MALSANQLEILISARDTASAVIHSVSKNLSSLGHAASTVGHGMIRAFTSVKDAIFNLKTGILALAGSAGFLALAKSVLETGGAFEDYKATLKTVLGTQEKANAAFAWIKDFAKTTPFEVEQLTQAFVRLSAYGIKGETVMRTLGNVASAMGKDIMSAVEALADANTGEFERLKEFGVKAIVITKENAKEMGALQEQIGKTALAYTNAHGQETIRVVNRNNRAMINDTLLAIWNEKYAGAMAERSTTMNGMLSNLKDAWTSWKSTVADMLIPAVKNAFGGLAQGIDDFSKNGTLYGWAAGVAEVFEAVMQWVAGFVSAFASAFVEIGKSLFSFQIDMESMKKAGKEFGEKLIEIFFKIKAWLETNGYSMWESFKQGIADVMTVISALAAAINAVIAGIRYLNKIGASVGAGLASATGAGKDGTRASGGGVVAGSSYMVGEKGPEMFTPSRSGVVNNSGGGQTVINNIYTAATAHGINNALASRSDSASRTTRVGMAVSNSRWAGNYSNVSMVRSR